MKSNIPKSHPRFLSLYYRDLLVEGVKRGITSLAGLAAHGRGEAFDYLLGEKTQSFAYEAIIAASATFYLSKNPVISVNGNTTILVPKELIELSQTTKALLEVNLFHPSKQRERNISQFLKSYGAKEVFLPNKGIIPSIKSNRRKISIDGQFVADLVFIPLEDGDRTQALKKMGKTVITIDLNPLSRTAQTADITIVDNIVRSLPLLIRECKMIKTKSQNELLKIVKNYDNQKNLSDALIFIRDRLTRLARRKI